MRRYFLIGGGIALGLALMPHLAWAQLDAMSGSNPSMTITATSSGMTAGWSDLYQGLWNATVQPIASASDSISGSLVGTATSWVKAGAVAMLMVWLASAVLNTQERVFMGMVPNVLVPIVVVLFVLANFHQYARDWLLNLPSDIGGVMSGVGSAPSNGSLFDALAAQAWAAGVAVWNSIPWSFSGLALGIAVVLYWAAAGAAVTWMFGLFVASKLTLYLLLSLAPLFVACLAFRPSRFVGKGAISVAIGAVVAQLLILALLSIILTALTAEVSKLATVSNQNLFSLVYVLAVAGTFLAFGAILTTRVSVLAAAVAGTTVDGIGAWVAAMSLAGGVASSAARGAAAAVAAASRAAGGGSSGGGNAARPAIPVAGRNMSA